MTCDSSNWFLVALQTTFFASIEAGMLVPVNTDPEEANALPSLINAANAGFLGALIMHVYAGKSWCDKHRWAQLTTLLPCTLVAQPCYRSWEPSF